MPFPPIPVYPKAYDDDYTLFLVHNTTETKLSADNSPWALEINIVAVDADKPEIWADNGFANIEGELLYYDSVAFDDNGKVNKLKGCARQIGGENTQFNKRGTWIRSFVIAEHHNQLVDAIMKTQNFIGYQFTPDQRTLDWRIRNLQALEVIFDDYSCPDLNFTFNIVENNPVTGVLATYAIQITPPNTISSFRLDFGDGEFTTSDLSGQHRYPVNATIDPVVSVSNDKCQIVQTPIQRSNPTEPTIQAPVNFEVTIPEFPDIPDFTFVPFEPPQQDINLPPLVSPCGISIDGQNIQIPSIIIGPEIVMVSNVVITGPDFPINLPSFVTISITGSIPSVIALEPIIPPTIIIDPPIPPTIVIVPIQSNIMFDLNFTDMPRLEVDWGNAPPRMQMEVTMAKRVKNPQMFTPTITNEFGKDFADIFEANNTMNLEYETVGLPTEIVMIPPSKESMTVDSGDLFKKKIQVETLEIKAPKDIKLIGPEEIDLVYRGPAIPLEVTGMPQSFKVELEKAIPSRIIVEVPKPLPEKIIVETNMPSEIVYSGPLSLPIFVPEDVFLPIKFPDKMPEIELVYKGAPIEFKVSMEEVVTKNDENRACFMMVPCTTGK